ncbi:MAG: hypothetical protein JJT95_04785 [Pararhodobacter sp.]|nr:hypothetical protein [Pararhodobacter sp.]
MDAEALFIAELNERLITHFTGAYWRVPLSQRHLPVLRASGARFGSIICADGHDVARALGDLATIGAPAPGEAMARALAALAGPMARMRAEEGFDEDGTVGKAAGAALALPPEAALPEPLPGEGPAILMSGADTPPMLIGAALIAAAGRGVIWKPSPRAAASAHLLMRHLGPLAAGRLALLQGDHASGAALAAALRGAGVLIWASPAPLPKLKLPVVRLQAG